ncbi:MULTISPECIES: hypothetical protein [Bacillus]|uniref:Uncharacterized protein n=1 Tax=Bacillus cereus TaxID=1396 RepID=A0A9X6B8H8_BACCE|nr:MULTISPECIES: hypothetical protein [Bacillus cereus group]MBG9522350.1 hypothetical protein [Bacillus thuringiensis]MCQ6287856.1 hypothetical protein [Bacillus cereus]MCQ6315971.1 hypothetical protein [Bacillus cereus]MCQ6327847.1 hypothetical protein [Bacillus cereus]MCQ6339921.1 hypothetical protein [Bacillus cereus]
MLIKAYIKKHMFQLPTQNNEQLEAQVEQKLQIQVDKSEFSKLYPLTKIEENTNILVDKQGTNIFLLNLLLMVLNHHQKAILVPEYYTNGFMIAKLEKETNVQITNIPFDNVEKAIMEYINPSCDKENTSKRESVLDHVEFSLNWLSKAQEELNHMPPKIKGKKN